MFNATVVLITLFHSLLGKFLDHRWSYMCTLNYNRVLTSGIKIDDRFNSANISRANLTHTMRNWTSKTLFLCVWHCICVPCFLSFYCNRLMYYQCELPTPVHCPNVWLSISCCIPKQKSILKVYIFR